MRRTRPEVYLIAESSMAQGVDTVDDYLRSLGASSWTSDPNNASEGIIEIASRSCYKSFGTELNPNITKVREGNQVHLKNILESGHGSVLEHASSTWAFHNVSRVFTHELVRHRVGTAISQESLRYMRVEDMGGWIPPSLENIPGIEQLFERTWNELEANYKAILEAAAHEAGVKSFGDLGFEKKKYYTSAARRILPIGLSTTIIWTVNMRELRHVLNLRTAVASEEEIRTVFNRVGEIALRRWPNIFQDFSALDSDDGLAWYSSENTKV